MDEFNHYKELRVTEDLDDDVDHVVGQTQPSDGIVTVERPRGPDGVERGPIKVEVVIEWLDDADDVDSTERGTFDFQAVRFTRRRSPSGDVTVDSAILRGQTGFRPIVIDDLLQGDRIAVRLTNIDVSSDAVKARILYREIT